MYIYISYKVETLDFGIKIKQLNLFNTYISNLIYNLNKIKRTFT